MPDAYRIRADNEAAQGKHAFDPAQAERKAIMEPAPARSEATWKRMAFKSRCETGSFYSRSPFHNRLLNTLTLPASGQSTTQ
jgi:hypothetical protein